MKSSSTIEQVLSSVGSGRELKETKSPAESVESSAAIPRLASTDSDALPQTRGRVKKAFRFIVLLAGAGVCGLTVTGFLGAYGWAFDQASHFRQQYLALLFVAVATSLLMRKWRWVLALAPFFLANLFVVAPYYLRSAEAPPATATKRRFLLSNVLILSRGYGRILSLVRETAPDVVVLQELSPEWKDALAGLALTYPYLAGNSPEDRFGIGVWSKIPMRSRILPATGAGRTSVEAELAFPEGDLTLVVTHPVPPMGSRGTQLRNEQLVAIGRHASQLSRPVVVVADLNATPWSHGFREFERVSGLRDSSRTAGLTPTWPSFLPGMRIPLDHCLVSPGIRVVEKRAGPFVSSDHLPLIVSLAL